jgi:hypothetical protein
MLGILRYLSLEFAVRVNVSLGEMLEHLVLVGVPISENTEDIFGIRIELLMPVGLRFLQIVQRNSAGTFGGYTNRTMYEAACLPRYQRVPAIHFFEILKTLSSNTKPMKRPKVRTIIAISSGENIGT